MSTGAATAASVTSTTSNTTTAGVAKAIESGKLDDKSLVVHFLICFTNKIQKYAAVVYEMKTASSNLRNPTSCSYRCRFRLFLLV